MGVIRFLYKTFKKIKDVMTSNQVLVHYDPKKPVTFATDTIPHGLRSVLFHTMPEGPEKPFAFASRPLASLRKSIYRLTTKRLEFSHLTDRQPLVSIFHPEDAAARVGCRDVHYSYQDSNLTSVIKSTKNTVTQTFVNTAICESRALTQR